MNTRVFYQRWLASLLALAAIGSSGCHFTKPFSNRPGPSVVFMGPPKELSKASLPDYVIEPPDVLTIDAINLVPQAPYLLRPMDVLQVQATGLPEDAPLPYEGQYRIGIDGTLVLGVGYDMVNVSGERRYQPLQVAGLPMEVARDLIQERLATIAREPEVWVTLLEMAPQQGIAGEHLVAPDGTINLGAYGRVRVVGLTLDQAKAAVEGHLSARFSQPEVALDVYGYNSKVYYVITQGAGLGDQIVQFPITGNETALDAVSNIQGMQANSSTRMWIARPGKNGCGGDQILPVDWLSITQRGDVTTNYQVMPGDRVFIAEDKLVALDTTLAKMIAPVERVLGVTLLGTQTAKQIKFFNNPNTGRF